MRPPTLREVREIGQKGSAEEFTLARVYGSRISRYLTWLAARTPLTPNAVTGLGVACGIAGGLLLLLPLGPVHLVSVVLLQLSYLLDFTDGELARLRGHSSHAGSYLDWLGHFYVPVLAAGVLGYQVGLQFGAAWFLAAVIAMIGLAAFHFSCKEHIVIAFLRKAPQAAGDESVQNAMRDRPFGGGVIGWQAARPSALDGLVRAVGSALIFPGAMHLLSLALVADLALAGWLGAPPVARAVLLASWGIAFAAHGALAVRRNFVALRQIDARATNEP